MEVAFPSVVMALAVQLWPPSLAAQSALFRKVLVSETRLMTSRRLESALLPLGTLQTLQCSAKCGVQPWCDLWWLSADQCFMSNMIVMPGYAETNMADALACFTRRHKDYATGALIQGTVHSTSKPTRVLENLVDGMYDRFSLDMCYINNNSQDYPWFVLDFGTPRTFHLVKLFSQPVGDSKILDNLTYLEARLGMSPVSQLGNFSSYAFFGMFLGPATSFDQEMLIEPSAPMSARYLSIQKVKGTETIQVCHLEVY